MAALKSLPPAVSALVRNPILVVLFGLFGLLQLPQLLLRPSQPILAALVSLGITGLFVLVAPFFQGGVLGMADEALAGRTGLGTLVSVGKSNYVALLLAYLLVFAVNFAFGVAAILAILFGGIGLYASEGQPGLAALVVVGSVGLLFVLAYLLFLFVVQFYAHAIVLSDAGLIEGFKRSVRLVRRNVASVLGYTLIVLAGGLLLGGVGAVASIFLSPQPVDLPLPDVSPPLLVGAGAVYVLALAALGAFYATYSVAFYREIDGRKPRL